MRRSTEAARGLSRTHLGAGGDWRNAGVSELADDVLAAVHFLRQREDIDPSAIGLEANSEGGWIAPVVAVRDRRIKLIVLKAGPALDYVPELMNEVEANVRAMGLTDGDLLSAPSFKQKAFEFLANGAGLSDKAWEQFQAFVRPNRAQKWFSYVGEPQERSPAQKKFYLMARLHPSEFWRQVTIPVLALYGGQDLNVPEAKNVAALTKELEQAGNHDYTIKVFANANHDGLETSNPLLDDERIRYLKRYVPGYFDMQMSWVLANLDK